MNKRILAKVSKAVYDFCRTVFVLLLLFCLAGVQIAQAGILVTSTNGISLTGADGISLTGADGISLTGADGISNFRVNGISLTGADGISLTGADGAISLTGADGSTYTGANGISLTGADGISLTGADGISLTGADGISLTGADGTIYQADGFRITNPTGISLTGADGISLTGADGISLTGADGIQIIGTDISLTGADGISLTGADGISLTGADGISLTGADGITAIRRDGSTYRITPSGAISLTGADGISLTGADISLTGADGISLTGADGITMTGVDISLTGADGSTVSTRGFKSLDPELAVKLNELSDDSNVNAAIVFHELPGENDLNSLRTIGILGGTRFRRLPVVIVSARRAQLIEVSRLANVRSIYGVRTFALNSDSHFNSTQISRVATDRDLQTRNGGMPVSGRGVTVAVLDTGINGQHSDLTGRVAQNVRLGDTQSVSVGFNYPVPVENLLNTDPLSGHGSFVAGVVAASGLSSGGKYNGVAPGARVLGLSAGDLNLTHVLSGFDYLLDRGAAYNARVVNCSFSANTIYDAHDPVNVATKILTERGISVVFSAGNSGSSNNTLNPYAAAPWVVSVGATDHTGKLAGFSSRGNFNSRQFAPSLVAPGVNVVSLRSAVTQTGALGIVGADTNRLTPAELLNYTTASGTSFSAPQVAGAIALMLEANPNLQPADIKDILQRTATPLPPYFAHEVGAGMLNTYAAVLESAFPNRQTGTWRAVLNRGHVSFVTDAPAYFNGTATPGAPANFNFNFPANTIQSTVSVAWGGLLNPNDLSLRVTDASGATRGESNNLNAPFLGGRSEKISFNSPTAGAYRAVVGHTGGIGTTQTFTGAVSVTRAEYAPVNDISALSPATQNAIKESLRHFEVLPFGATEFRPATPVLRGDFASALVRGGRVPQFVAATQMYSDVTDLTSRNAIESVQKAPAGALIFDAQTGAAFRPFDATSRLIAAVALVKAAGLQSEVAAAGLPPVADVTSIPSAWRGYVAVALQRGLLEKHGANFAPNAPLTRAELAQSMAALNRIFTE